MMIFALASMAITLYTLFRQVKRVFSTTYLVNMLPILTSICVTKAASSDPKRIFLPLKLLIHVAMSKVRISM